MVVIDLVQTGRNIESLRKKKGLDCEMVAQLIGAHPSTVTQWERGKSKPNLAYLLALSVLLEVNMEDILSYIVEDS